MCFWQPSMGQGERRERSPTPRPRKLHPKSCKGRGCKGVLMISPGEDATDWLWKCNQSGCSYSEGATEGEITLAKQLVRRSVSIGRQI